MGFSASLVLFLFFVFALLIHARVTITHNNDAIFYAVIISLLTCEEAIRPALDGCHTCIARTLPPWDL